MRTMLTRAFDGDDVFDLVVLVIGIGIGQTIQPGPLGPLPLILIKSVLSKAYMPGHANIDLQLLDLFGFGFGIAGQGYAIEFPVLVRGQYATFGIETQTDPRALFLKRNFVDHIDFETGRSPKCPRRSGLSVNVRCTTEQSRTSQNCATKYLRKASQDVSN